MPPLLTLLLIGLTNGAVIALNALGLTLIYAHTRALNLAHGDVFALTTVLVTTLVTALGLHAGWVWWQLLLALALILLVAMAFAGGLSWGIGQLAFAPFQGRSRLAPLIMTLGISFVLYQGALTWRYLLPNWIPGEHRSVPGIPEFPRDRIPEVISAWTLLQWGGAQVTLKDALVLAAAVGLTAGLSGWLQRGRFGRAWRACAQNPVLAQLCGVNPPRVLQQTFLVGGALAGAGAFVFAVYYTHPFNQHGAQSGLLAFTAVLLGGLGSPWGALAGGLLLGVVAAFSDYFWQAQWTPVLIQLLLIGLLWWRPTGLSDEAAGDDLTPTEESLTQNTTPSARWRWAAGGLFVFALFLPPLSGQPMATATNILLLALLALGLSILLGYAGLLDLGYAVSFGLGGYVAAWLTSAYSRTEFIAVALGSGVVGLGFGLLNGVLTHRLRSDYLAIVTLALGQLAKQTLVNFDGGTGMAALPPPVLFGYVLRSPIERYYLVLGVLALVALASHRWWGARVGRAWRAGSADEAAAASCGIPVAQYKTLAFMTSMALAGVGGALYASCFTYVAPELLDFHTSALVLAMVVLGGAGHWPGVLLSAIALATYDRVLLPALGGWLGAQQGSVFAGFDVRGLSYLNFGLALCVAVWVRQKRVGKAE